MKILLFYPYMTLYKDDVGNPSKCPLLGLGYIASHLKNSGHEAKIIDGMDNPAHLTAIDSVFTRYGLTDDQVSLEIENFNPDVVGISCMYTSYFLDALSIAKLAKKCNPEIFTILGGAHVTTFADSVMKDNSVDCAVIGEGEHVTVDIINRLEKKQKLDGIKGILHRNNGQVVQEEPRNAISDLDNLTMPAWDLMQNEKAMIDRLDRKKPFNMRHPVSYMISSRGCPRKCVYCSAPLVMGSKWRARSAVNVVDEIESLVRDFGSKEIHFLDDNMSISKSRLMEICQLIIDRKIDIKWTAPPGIGYWSFDEELLDIMKKSGCYRITMGIESGSEETLKLIGKHHNWEKLHRIVNYANKIGLWTYATFIIGFPDETEKDFLLTLNKAKSLNLDFAMFYLLIPQPGTRIYKIYKEKGLIDFDKYLDPGYTGKDRYKLATAYANGTPTEHFSQKELQDWLAKMFRSYMLHKVFSPRTYFNLIRKIRSFEDVRFMGGLIKQAFVWVVKSVFFKFNYEMMRRHKELSSSNIKPSRKLPNV